jgi:cytochrome c-type biogenesis protein CcmE
MVKEVLKKRRFLIGGIIVVLAIGYLAYTGFEDSGTYYYKVSEIAGPGSTANDTSIRVNGQVAPSFEREPDGLTLRFDIIEGGEKLPVVYHGTVPDAFDVGSDVVVEGYLGPEGVFHADSILTKCPSRYKPEN